ncbi:MAG: C40 family peptidase [Epsilonproteobacteria bacterium]|nr:C40 family peptidase [Campylobacterota bacterium]
MKNTLFLLILLTLFSGCVFQPPITIDEKIEVYEETEQAPQYTDASAKDLLVDEEVEKLLSLAYAQMGTPYVYGGSDFTGFDCSGFVNYVYKYGIGKNLPRTSRAQSDYTHQLERHELVPGDIVFFDTSKKGRINHCGIYMGNGKFIHASSGKAYCVTTSNLDRGFYKNRFKWGGRVVR